MTNRSPCWVMIGWVALFMGETVPARAEGPANGEEFFETQVRPVLVQHCSECHGEKKQEMSLRLDTRAGFQAGGESGPLIDTANPSASRLLTVLRHDGDIAMPPAGRLPDHQIQVLTQWVEMGAPWPAENAPPEPLSIQEKAKQHWAFAPVQSVPIPTIRDAHRARTPADAFLLAKLQEKGLSFSPSTDARTLLRRATYDLTGLPPTPEEVTTFSKEDRADAFERATDRLLASPHYGEKWGRHWLDVARYADTKGYVFVSERRYPFAFTYRNYVLESFNQDRPYDQFVREQLAADTLADPADKPALAALGYLTVGRRFLNNVPDIIDDRIDVVSRGMLGLSATCARCHDHKYDPISTEDYYALYGVFNSSAEPEERPTIGESESQEAFAAYEKALAAKQKAMDDFIARKRMEKEAKLLQELPRLVMAWHESSGKPDNNVVVKVAVDSGLSQNVVRQFMDRWTGFLGPRLKPDHPVFAVWAMYQQASPETFQATTEQLRTSAAMDQAVLPVVAKTFRESAPTSMKEVVERYCRLLTTNSPENKDIRQVLEEPGSPVKISLEETVGTFDQGERNELTNLRNQREQVRVVHPGAPPEAMILADTQTPQDSPIFLRGNPGRHGPVAVRRYFAFLDSPERPPFREGSGRKELALRIASSENPLTARVMVNRVWHWHFGRGLAPNPSDFGLRSDPPSHGELLDHLSRDFMDGGWSVKSLHREMMTSEVYRQASAEHEQGRSIDPENITLWRFRPRRLELEEMRDSMLSVAGELDARYLGRSVPIVGEKPSKRRSVYAYVDRQNLENFFRTFDFANPNTSAPLRFVTTVPQQALFLMNSSFSIERSRSLATAFTETEGSMEHHVEQMYWTILRRAPTPEERQVAVQFIHEESARLPVRSSPWTYGFGSVDASGRVQFQEMTHWKRDHWQARENFPDPEVSHLVLSSVGGHPGPNARYSAIRRFTAPAAGTLRVAGKLNHPAKNGDGIVGRICVSQAGEVGSWTVQGAEVETVVSSRPVAEGEAIDFVVEPRDGDSFDSFHWKVKVEVETNVSLTAYDSVKDFAGPTEPLSPWGKLAQVLLLSNEFAFVD